MFLDMTWPCVQKKKTIDLIRHLSQYFLKIQDRFLLIKSAILTLQRTHMKSTTVEIKRIVTQL